MNAQTIAKLEGIIDDVVSMKAIAGQLVKDIEEVQQYSDIEHDLKARLDRQRYICNILINWR